jgi:ribose transport system permease protein
MNEELKENEVNPTRKKIGKVLNQFMFHPIALPLVLFVIMLIVNLVLQNDMLTPRVIRSNVLSFSPLIMMAMGQAVIMLSGNLDLSVGTGMAAINCILATYMTDDPLNIVLVLVLGLAAAILMGLVNGFLVGYLKLPFLIATFGSLYLWLGLAMKITPIPGGYFPRFVSNIFKAHIGPFSVIVLVIIISVLGWGLVKRFRIGRYIYAVGSDSEAAFNNGINVKRVTLYAFAIGWVFIFLGALLITIQTRAADSQIAGGNMGETFLLGSVAAAVVGGIFLGGGRGAVAGAILGAIVLSMIMNVIYFAGIPASWQVFVRGAIMLLALSATVLYNKKYDTNE